jgi:hypothetical protein
MIQVELNNCNISINIEIGMNAKINLNANKIESIKTGMNTEIVYKKEMR